MHPRHLPFSLCYRASQISLGILYGVRVTGGGAGPTSLSQHRRPLVGDLVGLSVTTLTLLPGFASVNE